MLLNPSRPSPSRVREGAEGRGGFVAIAGVWSLMRTRLSCAALRSHSPLLGGIYK